MKLYKSLNFKIMNEKRMGVFLSVVGGLLMIPLVAMQFTNEVNWKFGDFVVMGLLLSGTALMLELILSNIKATKHRILFCAAAILTFVLVWMELAVGIFGTRFAGS